MDSFNINTTVKDVLAHLSDQGRDKTIIITGPSSGGIGGEVAIALSSTHPKQLILLGRTKSKITSIIESIHKLNPNIQVSFIQMDLLDNKSIHRTASKIKSLTNKIHLLINNAGVMAVGNYRTSTCGVESQFAANYLGHFLLTNLLMKEIIAAANEGATILQVGSLGYQLGDVNLEDVNFQDGKIYNPWVAYGQSKTACILFNISLHKRLKNMGVTALICHPGVTLESKLLTNSAISQELFADAYKLAIKRNDGEQSASTAKFGNASASSRNGRVHCISTDSQKYAVRRLKSCAVYKLTINIADLSHPAFIVEYQVYTETKEYALNEETAEGLWKLSEKLVGESFPL